MSVFPNENQEGPVDLGLDMGAAFATLMDTLVPDESAPPAEDGGAPAPADPGGSGQPAAPAEGAGAPAVVADGAPAGDGGDQGVPDEGQPAGTPAADGTVGAGRAAGVDYAVVAPKLGELSVALENRALEIRKEAALTDVQQEYPKYFDALKVHPRLLVGNTVPAIGREGTETLRDSADAKDWQDAVKQILAAEVQERARAAAEEDGGMMRTLHDAIELFQNNADMVPGTKQFDRDLADEFARMAKPYELRVEGKMSGYTIPVQPLINQIREQLAARRAKAATPPAAVQETTTAIGKAGPASAAKPAPAPPQAGIQAKAGAASEAENFDALFGTIGLSGFRI